MAIHALICPTVLVVVFVVINLSTKYSVGDVLVIGVITLGAFPWMTYVIRIVVFARGFCLR